MKYLISICGPNGAGKSTFTRTVFARVMLPIIDPDRFSSQGISEIAAGKLAVWQMNSYLASGVSFIRESTLSSKLDIRTIGLAKALGYRTILIYLYVPAPEMALQRIARRVCNGGHDIPPDAVRRRFERSLKNLEFIKGKVDCCHIIDSSNSGYHEHVEKMTKFAERFAGLKAVK